MKKIFIGLALLALSSCTSYLKGDYTLGRRNTFNDFFYTYNIRFYDTDELESVSKETETISDYKIGETKRALPGGVVVSSKIIQKEIFSSDIVRPNKKGALVSYTVPVEFSDEKVYKTIGEVEINDVVYRLVEPNRIGDVVLIDQKGKIYPRVGRIYNNRLALLETSFLLEPEGIYFMEETENATQNEGVVSSFEIRYIGIQNYQMVFEFVSKGSVGEETVTTETKTYKFPVYDENITIEGIKLEILKVDNMGLEYRVLGV